MNKGMCMYVGIAPGITQINDITTCITDYYAHLYIYV